MGRVGKVMGVSLQKFQGLSITTGAAKMVGRRFGGIGPIDQRDVARHSTSTSRTGLRGSMLSGMHLNDPRLARTDPSHP